MSPLPTATVVVPTYNRGHFLERSLASVLGQDYPPGRLDVVVVDDGSADGTAALLEGYSRTHPNFRYLRQSNRGPAAARNAALREATGELVLMMDDDCVAAPGWAAGLAAGYTDPGVGGVAGRIRFVPPADNLANRCAARGAADGPGQPLDAAGRIDHFVTANASFRRAVLEQVGGFDAVFRHAAQEDLDLSYRVKRAGWELCYTATAVVGHYHHYTVMGDLRRYYRTGLAEATMRWRYGRPRPVWAELPLGLAGLARGPLGAARNLLGGDLSVEGLATPLLYRLNNLMLAAGRTRGHLAGRRPAAGPEQPPS